MQSANSNNNPYVLSPPITSASNSPLASPAITPPSRAAGSPPTRNTTNATDSTYYTTEEGYSDDTTPDISAFTIINPSSTAGQASSTPNIPTSPPPQYHQVQQQQPSADTYQPLPRARTTSNSSIQLYIPYSQNAPTVSPLARLSTSTLIPLQVQRTQSPENPATGVSSLQGSLHSNSTDSNGSGVRDRVRNRHMSAPLMTMQPPPTIILETPSPSSSGTLAGHRQSALTALTAAAASAGMPSTSTASGAGRRARSASGSSLPRYYSPQASFDDVALRTVEDVGSDGEAESEAAAARAGRPRTAEVTPLFSSLGGKRPRLSSIVRRSYGP
ncbi:hypothetical protein BFW01_g12093 [Lasiodiplodia theobromae]|nr:hypothetical protein BFW01_g12093 [Lasiodiplodia theobromae]